MRSRNENGERKVAVGDTSGIEQLNSFDALRYDSDEEPGVLPRARNIPNDPYDKRRYQLEDKGMSFGAIAVKSSVEDKGNGSSSVCRAEGLMVAASRVLDDVDGSADNDEFDKIIAEHTRIVEIDRHTLVSQLAGASYTDEVIAEVKMQGTRDDANIGTSTPLDGNMWKSKLRCYTKFGP